MKEEKATLAGGCFWCLEAAYLQVRGVSHVQSGYCGGTMQDPSYELVCSGQTGHAETVQLTFDPEVVSYRDLLMVFFLIHDPTTLNRQGADVGTHYRSAIFYHSEQQKQIAEDMMAELEAQNLWPGPIVTELAPIDAFYAAEEYHERYYERNSQQPYCSFTIAPKLAELRKEYLALLDPALT
jgi:peptide-methionine (S)-S-oxide reductase